MSALPAAERSEAVLPFVPSPPQPEIRIEPLGPGLGPAWDEMVRTTAGGTFFHLMGWKRAVERAFGHRSHYLVARRGARLAGLLPLGEVGSVLFGRCLVSLPHAIAGGVVSEDPAATAALLAEARRLAAQRRVDYLELRCEDADGDGYETFRTRELYVTFRADLGESEEALLRRMDRKRRQMMTYVGNRAKAGFSWEIAGEEALPVFYRLFCEAMRHHGTPVYPRRFLRELLRQNPGETHLFLVSHGGRVVQAVLNLLFEGQVMPFYSGAVHGPERPRGVDDYTYLQIMRWAREHDYQRFDFGRSKLGTGAYKFKQRWGMEEVPLNYRVHLLRGAELPNVSPANPRYARAIATWQRLPLWLTRIAGPPLVARIP
jgi:FemAB-related protein (PEP-CTERM system-associated)